MDYKPGTVTLSNGRELKIDLRKVTDQLETDGVQQFVDSYDKLISGLRAKKESLAPALARK